MWMLRTQLLWSLPLFAAVAAVWAYAQTPTLPARAQPAVDGPTATPSSALQYPAGAEVAIILVQNRFHPNEIRLAAGSPATLVFATVNKKSAALILEPLAVQRWLASDSESSERMPPAQAITREVNHERVTTVSFEPRPGKYKYVDALGGARGEIIVE